ncbi:MAG: hypothetical protein AB7V77_04925 [Candidatus Woesearchaeota archaeon]
MSLNEMTKLRGDLLHEFWNVEEKLKTIYEKEEYIPLPNELFNQKEYRIKYYDYEIFNYDLNKIKEDIQIIVKSHELNKKEFLGNFSYSLNKNKVDLITPIMQIFDDECVNTTGICLTNHIINKSEANNPPIKIRFCFFLAGNEIELLYNYIKKVEMSYSKRYFLLSSFIFSKIHKKYDLNLEPIEILSFITSDSMIESTYIWQKLDLSKIEYIDVKEYLASTKYVQPIIILEFMLAHLLQRETEETIAIKKLMEKRELKEFELNVSNEFIDDLMRAGIIFKPRMGFVKYVE